MFPFCFIFSYSKFPWPTKSSLGSHLRRFCSLTITWSQSFRGCLRVAGRKHDKYWLRRVFGLESYRVLVWRSVKANDRKCEITQKSMSVVFWPYALPNAKTRKKGENGALYVSSICHISVVCTLMFRVSALLHARRSRNEKPFKYDSSLLLV